MHAIYSYQLTTHQSINSSRKMCGIIGIKGQCVAKEIFVGLLALQHRGQNSAGISTYDGERFYTKKGNGLVSQVLSENSLPRLKGGEGIGHVRYPTIGSGDEEDAQPFLTNSPFGIVMAHNGNVVNYFDLRHSLGEKRHLNSFSDVEVLLNIFADNLKRDPFEAAGAIMEMTNGAYSVVSIIAGLGLFAFRDPQAIRRFIFGRRGENYIFASESVVLQILGYDIIKDLAPGEGILVDEKCKVTQKMIKVGTPRHCIFEYIYIARPDSVLDNISVYKARLSLGRELAKGIKRKGIKPDVVVPIPDTSRPTAIALAEEIGVPYREGLIKNRYILRTFIMTTDAERIRYIKYKLNPLIDELKGKKVLLVDDSIVRGTTSRQIVQVVKNAGPKEIYFAISAPPIRNPCYYGIDMQTRGELIAREKSEDEIRDVLKVDCLIYQTINGLKRAIGKDAFCMACFDGDYPTRIKGKEMLEIEEKRKKVTRKKTAEAALFDV